MVSRSRDARRCDHETGCFYCEMPLTADYEQDHYPVPKVAGGTETVPPMPHLPRREGSYPSW